MLIHSYDRQHGGAVEHRVTSGQDHGGPLQVTGDIIPLTGWPTPAMRSALASNGDDAPGYIGTDEQGNILHV